MVKTRRQGRRGLIFKVDMLRWIKYLNIKINLIHNMITSIKCGF